MAGTPKKHWFILRMPVSIQDPNKVLQQASDLCVEAKKEYGDASPFPLMNSKDGSFEFFAPKIMLISGKGKGALRSRTDRITNHNYVFIYEREEKIFELKTKLLNSKIMFLPALKDSSVHYPYLRNSDIDVLKKLEAIHNEAVPLVLTDRAEARQGDRIRILTGPYKDMEATVVTTPRSKNREIVVALNDWGYVPLGKAVEGDYEIVEFQQNTKHEYEAFRDDGAFTIVFDTLKKKLTDGCRCTLSRVETDRMIQIIRTYRAITTKTNVMRCKQETLLLYAYLAIDLHDEVKAAYARIEAMLKETKAEQSRVQLLTALYVASHSYTYCELLNAIVAKWKKTELSKTKKHIIKHFEDFYSLINN